MGHKALPRDSCGGAKSCGGNLMAADAPAQRESIVRRNVRAMIDFIFAFKASREMSRKSH